MRLLILFASAITTLGLGAAVPASAQPTQPAQPAQPSEAARPDQPARPGQPVKLLAAGSLKAALTEASLAFTKAGGPPVEAGFGPSGLLRDRILGGEAVDVFASANLAHPRAIAKERGGEVQAFASNMLCALAQPGLEVRGDTLLARLLDPAVRVGTSTPKADPAGDYAWQFFDRAGKIEAGADRTLKDKALQLTGGPDSPKPPAERSVYAWVMENEKADIFLTYCTNAVAAVREVPKLQIVPVPEELSVGANYGLIVLGDSLQAEALAAFILSPEGQAVLARHGFGPPRSKEAQSSGG